MSLWAGAPGLRCLHQLEMGWWALISPEPSRQPLNLFQKQSFSREVWIVTARHKASL